MTNLKGAAVIVQKRAQLGLFAGKHIRFGNNVSHSNRKTRRSFKPNIQDKRYYSDALQKHMTLEVSTHAMRCIDKAGGLDLYLLKQSKRELKGQTLATELRAKISAAKATLKQQPTFAATAAAAEQELAVAV